LEREIAEKAKEIRMLVMDVDGVMTDGMISFGTGHQEIKSFFVQDGLGLRLAKRAGLLVALISSRESEMVVRRARELEIDEVHQKVRDKLEVWNALQAKYALSTHQMAMMGDDWGDLPLLLRAGLSIAVADAAEEVKKRVHYVTRRPGGRGAVREAIEFILKAQGRYDRELQAYLR